MQGDVFVNSYLIYTAFYLHRASMLFWTACVTTIDDEAEYISAILGAIGNQLESFVTTPKRVVHAKIDTNATNSVIVIYQA